MMFKSPRWRLVAIALGVLNVAGAGYAAALNEPAHAAIHGALAAAFALGASRLRRPAARSQDDRLELLETELDQMRQQLTEAQDRLDFAERLLARRPDAHRVGGDG